MKLIQYVVLFSISELVTVLSMRLIVSSEELSAIDIAKPIARYLTGNSKHYCKWCNLRPEKNEGKNKPNRETQLPEEIDLFDIPIYAAMTQDQGTLDKERLTDFIGKYF